MKTRLFGSNKNPVSEIGLGAWQLGADWGDVEESTALAILKSAVDSGVTFFDTADVYGAGRSESIIGKFLKDCPEDIFVATKLGRFPEPGLPDNISETNFKTFIEASINRLGVEALDLTQLHCIPTHFMEQGDVFEWLRKLQQEGKIKHFGASVESMDEAILCMKQEGLTSLQIIFNIFRQKPIDTIFNTAKEKNIALIIRLPLASGLLGGKYSKETTFAENDHRNYNRDGQMFNVGETFAGLKFDQGLEAVEALRPLVPNDMNMAQMALRWILDHDAVTTIIPGARSPEQAKANASASDFNPLPDEVHQQLKQIYEEKVKPNIRGPY